MLACTSRIDGRLICACSSSSTETMLANGLAAGFAAADLVIREVTPDDLAAMIAHNAAQDAARRPAAERRAERYRAEVDPLVAVWSSYLAEGAPDKAAALAGEIAAAKARIRAEIPDAPA